MSRKNLGHIADTALDSSSNYPVQNKVIKQALDGKANANLVPAQASPQNQLADKNFVNSSIGTNTANYISNAGQPFTSLAQLQAYTGTVTNNDYAFVTGTDSAGNTYFDRYKATVNGSSVTWAKEYRLNNSSFTAEQWAAISSGITALLVQNYNAHLSATNNPHNVTKAQVGLGNVNNTSDANKPISTATQSALNNKLNVAGDNGTAVGVSALINKLATGSDTPVDNDYYVSQYANGGTTNTDYRRRPISALWNYIKNKICSQHVTSIDANTIFEFGCYSGVFTNVPKRDEVDYGYGTLFVMEYKNPQNRIYPTQIYMCTGDYTNDMKNTFYYRTCNNGVYNSWQSFNPSLLENKVDKVTGKGLSTNDYTTTDKTKLAGIETGANKTTVDSSVSSTSTNPLQNKVVNSSFMRKFSATTMQDLGFTAGSTVDVGTFLEKIRTTYGSRCVVDFIWSDAKRARLTDDTNTTDWISGYTLFMGLNNVNTESGTWQCSGGLLVPVAGNSNMYVISCTISDTSGTISSKKVIRLSNNGHKHSADDITSGTLPLAHGGTGVTTQRNLNKNIVGDFASGTYDVTDGTHIVTSYASDNGFSQSGYENIPYKRTASKLWNYIKKKLHTHFGSSTDANTLFELGCHSGLFTNTPKQYGTLFVMEYKSASTNKYFTTQIFIPAGDYTDGTQNNLYFRSCKNDVYNSWQTVSPSSLAAVATSGSYNDLTNKPTIPAAQVQTDWNATSGIGVLKNKPSTFPPSSHNQASNTINAMTGYTKPVLFSAITPSDTLNQAIGKLEASITQNSGTATFVIEGTSSHISERTFVQAIIDILGYPTPIFSIYCSCMGMVNREACIFIGLYQDANGDYSVTLCDIHSRGIKAYYNSLNIIEDTVVLTIPRRL